MKRIYFLLFISFLYLTTSCTEQQSKQTTDNNEQHSHSSEKNVENQAVKKPLSPRTNATANIGDVHVHIDYSSPSVRGRTIWGGLVAYDQVWVTGAHKATSIDFNKDVMIDGQKVEAGKYGFFTIPGKESWTVIINNNHEQHLADDYDEALDILRLEVSPEALTQPMESLTYEVTQTGEKTGTVSVMWDKLKVSFDLNVI